MKRFRALRSAALLAVLLTSALVAQEGTKEDRLREALRAFGEPTEGESAAEQASRQRWPEYERAINAAIREQDRVLAEGGARLQDALALYESRASALPRSPEKHYLAGRLLGMMGRLDEARVHFEQALALDPHFYWAHHGLGSYFANRGMPDPARKRYERALELNPAFIPSAHGLAMSQIRLNNYDAAEQTLTKILNRHPGDSDALWILANLLVERTRYAEAIAHLQRIERIEPGREDVSRCLALCYRRTDQVDQAVEIYETLLAINPQDHEAHLYMGEILQRKGENHRAANHYESALQYLPANSRMVRANLQALIDKLRSGPPVEVVSAGRKSAQEWIEILLNSADVERQREAARVLGSVPRFRPEIAQAFLQALKVRDPEVRTLALKTIDRWWTAEGLQRMMPLLKIMLRDRSPLVRGMTASLLGRSDVPDPVPALVEALKLERDPYAFRLMYEALNELTFAYIAVIPPKTMDFATMERIQSSWTAWYGANRFAYQKFEDPN